MEVHKPYGSEGSLLAAMESAIDLIEAERLNYNPRKNNSPHQP